MIGILKSRLSQGYSTIDYPSGSAPEMPARFLGVPSIKSKLCRDDCNACREVCPTGAISIKDGAPAIDLGRCVFCGQCQQACPSQAIEFSRNYQLTAFKREDLIVRADTATSHLKPDVTIKKLFGRSLRLRQVCAGGCGACEADTNVLGTVGWDLGRFGIQFVASPRHADGLLVTGSVTKHMKSALIDTYEAVPNPKVVIAVGACAISGGLFESHKETREGVTAILPVDLFIPGCPPHPMTILDGLLQFLGKVKITCSQKGEE